MDASATRKGMTSLQLTKKIHSILDQAYALQANNAINLFKNLEPIIVGIVLQNFNPDHNDQELIS